jgi:hypothetical protein
MPIHLAVFSRRCYAGCLIPEFLMPVRAAQSLVIARRMEDEARLRRGIGMALLLASLVWIGVFYAVLLLR